MNNETIAVVLKLFGVDPKAFDLGQGTANEAYCLTREPDGWHVFYSERAMRTGERVFQNEWEASDALLQRIAADPLSRVNAPRHHSGS